MDIIQQEAVLTAQLTNLFQIEDANDRVIECIATIEGLPAAADPAPAQTSVEEGRLSLLCVEHQSLQWRGSGDCLQHDPALHNYHRAAHCC